MVGASTSTLVTITDGCTGLRIGMLSPNISGTLTYNNTNVPSAPEQQFMKHSWVSIYTDNYSSYVSGTSTNWQGKFAAFLPAGTYFVDSYSNSRFAARSTLRLTVKVATVGEVTTVSWKYRNQNDSAYVTTPIAADFDYVPPNVRISLSPSLTSSHVILVKDLDANSATREQPRRFVSNGTLASGVLTKGKTYSIRVVPNYQETLTGTCEVASAPVTISESEVFAGGTANTFNLTSCVPQP
jgi:predicted DNA-binding protein with PD1-like motif